MKSIKVLAFLVLMVAPSLSHAKAVCTITYVGIFDNVYQSTGSGSTITEAYKNAAKDKSGDVVKAQCKYVKD